MQLITDISARVSEYGEEKFYEVVREHISDIMTHSGLQVYESAESIRELYHRYAAAYILGCKKQSVDVFIHELLEESSEDELMLPDGNLPSGFLSCEGDEEQHRNALIIAASFFNVENAVVDGVLVSTGLASVIQTLVPGQYISHAGDDFLTMVMTTWLG